MENTEPRPSGYEGLADIRIIQAIRKSALTGTKVYLQPVVAVSQPGPELIAEKPKVARADLINAKSGSR